MSNKDEELYNFTIKMMENITSFYLSSNEKYDQPLKTMIERGVSRKISDIWDVIPKYYTEVEVDVYDEVTDRLSVFVTFKTDDERDDMVAMYSTKSIGKEEDGISKYVRNKLMKKLHNIDSKSLFAPVGATVSPSGQTTVKYYNSAERIWESRPAEPEEEWDVTAYDPTSLQEDYFFGGNCSAGLDSKVETLPGGKTISEMSDLEYFQKRVYEGMSLPAGYGTEGVEPEEQKPSPIDFSQISQLDPAEANDWRIDKSVMQSEYVAIDLNKITGPVKYKEYTPLGEEMTDVELKDKFNAWARGTTGWSDEYTVAVDMGVSNLGTSQYLGDFAGVETAGSEYVQIDDIEIASMDDIEFTIEELDELIDFFEDVQSEVMTFA